MSLTDFGLTETAVSTLALLYSFLFLILAAAGVFLFFLKGYGIYKMSKKLGVRGSWYSFAPITNSIAFGKIADKVTNKKSAYKNALLALYVIKLILTVLFLSLTLLFAVKLLFAADLAVLNGEKLDPAIFKEALSAVIFFVLTVLFTLVYGIVKTVCAAKIYKALGCKYPVLNAVVGFIFPVTFPFFAYSAVKEILD